MSETRKPVWVWLPGNAEPVQCGQFSLHDKVGSFEYLSDYRDRPDALALDPVQLPLTRAQRSFKEVRQGGLFGVLRDASPEGYGLSLLESIKGMSLHDPMLRLELSEGDAVGAIEVCDDLDAKLQFTPPTSDQLLTALAALPPERPGSQAARDVKGLHGTSLGGERPKLTVLHEGQYWIAKLQDRGDPPHAPLREYLAMSCAQALGLDVAPVQFRQVGPRQLVLVRRFDRHVDACGGVRRRLYASAHTLLRLDTSMRGDKARSYVALARELQRYCADAQTPVLTMQQELWRRMAFNVICGNGDDHPRNHGIVHVEGHWRLSPAFDMAPYITYSGTQAMAITRSGSSVASRANLLSDSASFGLDRTQAEAFIDHAADQLPVLWQQKAQALGFEDHEVPAPQASLWL